MGFNRSRDVSRKASQASMVGFGICLNVLGQFPVLPEVTVLGQ